MSRIINFVFLMASVTFPLLHCTEQPEISIDYIRRSDSHKWIKETDGDYVKYGDGSYMISLNTVALAIVCKAPYPVYWTMNLNWEESFLMLYDLFTYMERKVPDGKFKEESSYKYSTTLVLQAIYKELTGNYVCVSAIDQNVNKSAYMYFEDIPPPFLAKAGKTVTVTTANPETVVLPCNSYNQDVRVFLFKETVKIAAPFNTSESVAIEESDSVRYDPKIGFTITVQDFPDILGRYKCATNETDDSLYIDIKREKGTGESGTPEIESNKLEGSAAYYWNNTNFKFYCCSNSEDKPPEFLIQYYCDNQPLCKLKRQVVATTQLNETSARILGYRPPSKFRNCSYVRVWEDTSYVMHCKGQGINLLTELYSTIHFNGSSPIYDDTVRTGPVGYTFDVHTQWDSVSSLNDQIYSIKILPFDKYVEVEGPEPEGSSLQLNAFVREIQIENGKPVLYIGETVTFYCHFTEYFFARGNMWAFTTTNGSINIIYAELKSRWQQYTTEEFYPYRRDGSRNSMMLVITKDINSVQCHAPVWNSTKWGVATLSFLTKVPTIPTIEGRDLETVYWTLNDTNMILECRIGMVAPLPTLTWTKDGSVIRTDNKTYTVTKGNVSSSLQVHFISHEVHGQYACSATNIGGKSTKIFNVFVAERHSLGLIIGGSVSIIAFLAALISFFYWKMKVQRNSLENLRANVYSSQ